MNYDEYIKEVGKFSGDEAVFRLLKHLEEWKEDDSDVMELASWIERVFYNFWIESEETRNHLYSLWSKFKKESIEGIGGMTMNERLYRFCLFERFDSLQSEEAKKIVYEKLCANA